MDFRYTNSQDEADLSVGLSVTCSTSEDNVCRSGIPGVQHPYDPSSSSYYMNYYTADPPHPNVGSVLHTPDFSFSQSMLLTEHGGGFSQREEFKSDAREYVNLDRPNYEVKKNKPHSSKEKKNTNYGSSKKSYPEAHKMQVCKTCGKTFKFQTSLLRHNNKVHFCRYQCRACCRVFSRQSYLDVHTSKPGTSCFIEQKVKHRKRTAKK